MDAIAMLESDHRKVEDLFERYQSSPDAEVVRQICTELTVHSLIEEEVIYPVLEEVPDGSNLRREAEHEHQEVKDAIAEIEQAGYDPQQAGSEIQHLMEGVTHHVQEEESEVLPNMRDALGSERITGLGDRLAVAKLNQLRDHDALEELTGDELYELARATGIEGRSDMNKDDLIAALKSR